jgi:hypothetical protein
MVKPIQQHFRKKTTSLQAAREVRCRAAALKLSLFYANGGLYSNHKENR